MLIMKTWIAITASSMEEQKRYRSAGADKVVFAMKGMAFSALDGISVEELESGKVDAVLMNRLFFSEELPEVKRVFEKLKEQNVSQIYFSDPSILDLADELGMTDRLIYRPETLMTSQKDASWWLSQGIGGVSISNLLTRQEVEEITQSVNGCVLSIHGHQLMSVSRRRLLQAYERNTNPKVSLAFRKDLSIQELKRDTHMPIYEDEKGTYIYTDYVQESFEEVQSFQEHGCTGFYMDSVYSSIEENEAALQAYCRILNGANAQEEKKQHEKAYPEQTFHTGYYEEKTVK